jgi:hypothetical protein
MPSQKLLVKSMAQNPWDFESIDLQLALTQVTRVDARTGRNVGRLKSVSPVMLVLETSAFYPATSDRVPGDRPANATITRELMAEPSSSGRVFAPH